MLVKVKHLFDSIRKGETPSTHESAKTGLEPENWSYSSREIEAKASERIGSFKTLDKEPHKKNITRNWEYRGNEETWQRRLSGGKIY